MLELGVNTNNECGTSDDEILHNIKSAGFKNIMLSYRSGDIEHTIKTAQKLGLNVAYFHTNNIFANDLWARGEINEKYVKSVISQIELCGKYNIPIAVMHATIGSPTDFAVAPNKHGLDCMQRILEVAKQNNVKIALENIDCFSIKHLFYLLDNIKSSHLGFCYDVGHHHLYNPKTNLVKKYADRLFAVHLHDNLMDWTVGYDYSRDLHLLPFDGKIPYEKVCKNLNLANYKGIVMLELHKTDCLKREQYENLTNENYLKLAYQKAEKLATMIEK